jgi:hypothetical protein
MIPTYDPYLFEIVGARNHNIKTLVRNYSSLKGIVKRYSEYHSDFEMIETYNFTLKVRNDFGTSTLVTFFAPNICKEEECFDIAISAKIAEFWKKLYETLDHHFFVLISLKIYTVVMTDTDNYDVYISKISALEIEIFDWQILENPHADPENLLSRYLLLLSVSRKSGFIILKEIRKDDEIFMFPLTEENMNDRIYISFPACQIAEIGFILDM